MNKIENFVSYLRTNVTKIRFDWKLLFYPDLAVALTYKCNLNCPYCYQKGLLEIMPDEFSLDDFKLVLDWLHRQHKNNVLLYGGEPTVHSKIRDILHMCKKRMFNIGFYTNGLFNQSLIQDLDKTYVKLVQVNFNHPSTYKKQDYQLMKENLAVLKKKGIKVILRYVINDDSMDYQYIIDNANKYKSEIMAGVSFKGYSNNEFISFENRAVIKKNILRFIDATSKKGIIAYFAHPLPRCLFNDREWRYLEKKAFATSRCNVCDTGQFSSGVRIVNPNLSVFACFFTFYKAQNLLDFNDLEELNGYFRDKVYELQWKKTLFEECSSCNHFLDKVCQGGCLGAKNK